MEKFLGLKAPAPPITRIRYEQSLPETLETGESFPVKVGNTSLHSLTQWKVASSVPLGFHLCPLLTGYNV